jgi:phosphoribosylamine--glycine ligase
MRPLIVAPGNAGIATDRRIAPILPIEDGGRRGAPSARNNASTFVVVGPEAPLAAGVADRLRRRHRRCLAPLRRRRGWRPRRRSPRRSAKCLCARPRRAYGHFTEAEAQRTIRDRRNRCPIVVKADGLAAGKGVVIA